jgi:uncharacterized lipoprotein YbaY
MKPTSRLFALLGLVVALAGCANLDLSPETDPQRVVAGAVRLPSGVVLSPEAVVTVQVVDSAWRPAQPDMAGTKVTETAVPQTSTADRLRKDYQTRTLGEQVIRAPGASPIPFRIEFHADDAMLRRGLNIDVRVTQDGKLRFRTLNAHLVTLGSAAYPHDVAVEAVQ